MTHVKMGFAAHSGSQRCGPQSPVLVPSAVLQLPGRAEWRIGLWPQTPLGGGGSGEAAQDKCGIFTLRGKPAPEQVQKQTLNCPKRLRIRGRIPRAEAGTGAGLRVIMPQQGRAPVGSSVRN